jgi:uncharacterized protein (DUF433 family)
MAEQLIAINYIAKTPEYRDGNPHIAGRHIMVDFIVDLHINAGMTIEEIERYHDLTPAQIYAALSYYYDHTDEIQAIWDEARRIAAQHPFDRETSLAERDRLRARLKERDPNAYERMMQMAEDPGREMTPPEITYEFGVSEQAVRKAAAEGWIAARKAGKIWLIRRGDAVARWGKKDGEG